MGCEKRGKGCALLYALPSCELCHRWEHAKVVWCVRVSPDSQILAACGYDMQMTLYATETYELLHRVKYPVFGGPSFIWSCAFSASTPNACACLHPHTCACADFAASWQPRRPLTGKDAFSLPPSSCSPARAAP